MTTKQGTSRTLVGLTVFSLLGAGTFLAASFGPHNPDDRVVTLATAWGDGKSAAGSAYMLWHTTSHGTDHQMQGGGHWEKLIHARVGDHVTLTGTASNGDPLSCSISSTGATVHGGARCEILSLP